MRWFLLAAFVVPVAALHWRGRVRLRWWRQLVDHSAVLAPINALFFALSKVPARPFLDRAAFPELDRIEREWRTIRDEALALAAAREIKAASQNDDASFNSFFKYGWKRFYLKWYGEPLPSAEQLCPRTVALLRETGCVKAALFAELPPGGKLNPHRDPFGGSLRYHLGLATPNDDRCWIEVDGERYSWRDGQGVVFDETYVHHARNDSDANRIILFCDIERPLRWRWAERVNHWFGARVVAAAASPNAPGDATGWVNKLFKVAWHAGRARRRFKSWSPLAYQATRAALVVAVVGALVFA